MKMRDHWLFLKRAPFLKVGLYVFSICFPYYSLVDCVLPFVAFDIRWNCVRFKVSSFSGSFIVSRCLMSLHEFFRYSTILGAESGDGGCKPHYQILDLNNISRWFSEKLSATIIEMTAFTR